MVAACNSQCVAGCDDNHAALLHSLLHSAKKKNVLLMCGVEEEFDQIPSPWKLYPLKVLLRFTVIFSYRPQ